ncbi:MAG: branched-chain amino acid ABC transporter permease, partial [Candidatus Methanomethyliaceae archaeon]
MLVERIALTLSILSLSFLISAPIYVQQYTVLMITHILMYIIITVSWVIFSGPTGYISLGSAAFVGIGVYLAAELGDKLPFFVVVLVSGLLASVLACVLGAFTLRLKGIYFAMFSFGLVEVILNIVQWYKTNMTATVGLMVIPIDSRILYYMMAVVLIILMLLVFLLRRSKYGLALRSIGQSEEAAEHIGVNTTALKIAVFAISAFFPAAAGAIIA